MKTRAAYMKAPWQFELRDVDLPDDLDPGWLRIRVAACGVCGTDLTAAAESDADWHAFGHELSGVVDAVGPEVMNVAVGDAIALQSSSYCGSCELCRNGRVDLCAGKVPSFWGQPAMGFSDYMLAPANHAVPYSGLDPDIAALAEPVGVAYDMVKTADIQMGECVCVVGPGPIALAALALAKHCGASRLVCIGHSHSTARLECAAALGAEVIAEDDSLADRDDLHRQFDHVLMTAPTQCIAPSLALLAYGGEMTYIGIGTGNGMIAFDANDFHFRKLQLRASFASPAIYFPAVLELLKSGVIPGEQLISHRYPLADIASAMIAQRDDKASTIKTIINP